MGFMDRVRKLFGRGAEVSGLGETEGLALIEALLMTAHVDGQVTDEEQQRFAADLAALPLTFCADAAEREAVVEKTRLKIIADRHLSADEFARGIASRVPAAETRQKILTLAAALAAVDGVDEVEKSFLGSLARAFDIDESEVTRLIGES